MSIKNLEDVPNSRKNDIISTAKTIQTFLKQEDLIEPMNELVKMIQEEFKRTDQLSQFAQQLANRI